MELFKRCKDQLQLAPTIGQGDTMSKTRNADYYIRHFNTSVLKQMIRQHQDIQKVYHHSHPRWIRASEQLAPLFEEMARREGGNK